MLKFYGARLYEVEAGNFDEAIKVKNDMCAYDGWFTLNQFDNPLNIECHLNTTFIEILNDTYFDNV
jgi:cysteine synthase